MLAAPTGAVVEVVDGGEAPTLGAVVVVSVEPVVPVVPLGLVDAGGTNVVVVLDADVLVADVLVVVVDFGGAAVVVVVVVVVSWWETGLVFGGGRWGYWMYRAPKPRKATTIRAVDRRTRSRWLTGRLMKPRRPRRFGRCGRFDPNDPVGRRRRFGSSGFGSLPSVTAPSWSHRRSEAS